MDHGGAWILIVELFMSRLTLGGNGPAVSCECKRVTPVPCDWLSSVWTSVAQTPRPDLSQL